MSGAGVVQPQWRVSTIGISVTCCMCYNSQLGFHAHYINTESKSREAGHMY